LNWQLYIAKAEEVLQIAGAIIASNPMVEPRQALETAHDLVAAHARNLGLARKQLDEATLKTSSS